MSRAAVEQVAKQQWEWARKQGSKTSLESIREHVAKVARVTDQKRGKNSPGKERSG